MPAHIVIFNVVSVVGVIALGGYFAMLSRSEHRIHPGLWVMLGNLSIFWLEGPYDKFGFCNYHPAHWMFPREGWGPLSAPFSGLPVLIPLPYVVYFTVPAMIAVAIARRVVTTRCTNVPMTLLTTGLLVGILWDVLWENIGVAVGIWRFESAASGLVLNAGERNQYPLYSALAMAIMVMFSTYLLGREDAALHRSVLEDWAERRTATRGGRLALTAAASIVLAHAVYIPTMLPYAITYAAGMQTERVRDAELFPGYNLPRQPVAIGDHAGWGAPIFLLVLGAAIVGVYAAVRRFDVAGRQLTSFGDVPTRQLVTT